MELKEQIKELNQKMKVQEQRIKELETTKLSVVK
jgi:hypothetical protein